MFNFDKVEAPQRLNRDFVLSKVTDAQIFYYYFGKFDLRGVYPSKFHKDRTPSTGFYVSKSGKLIYNHFNEKEPKMDCFAYVQRMYNCQFKDAVKRIALDFGLLGKGNSEVSAQTLAGLANFDRTYKKETKIHFVAKKWDSEALAFFNRFHIDRSELKRDGYYYIDKLYINEQFIPNNANCMRFALTVPYKDQRLTKVYSPGGTDQLKWVSNIPLDMPFGLDKLDKTAPFSFGAKALKDMTVIKKFLPAVYATQNESQSAMSEKTMKMLKFYYPKNYLGWDNDETGLEAMAEMEPKGFTPLPIENPETKDYSDFVEAKDLKGLEKFFIKHKLI